ncbi:hypothetical protein CALVIDRAFT_536938 [Calocera viscosa TUFC12733]|uniref:CHAT domain-containing protein n=1 Tax=Calocera viscosa (strain TUFC12733) TaxID=1330018 RepID=A0A167MCG3_CALVF|nr:hypothetical protein CALVIDRAFT_536938 [Calocera viscosa TUFC12733]
MQIAGFRGLLATQWGMVDRDGPALVNMFYGYVAEAGFSPGVRKAAKALHRSLQQFRERGCQCSDGLCLYTLAYERSVPKFYTWKQ